MHTRLCLATIVFIFLSNDSSGYYFVIRISIKKICGSKYDSLLRMIKQIQFITEFMQ